MSAIKSTPTRVLVFNPLKKLVAIYNSFTGASKTLKISHQAIVAVCKGTSISANGLYFRYLNDNIEITLEDLGTLKLQEYDSLCDVKRVVYKTKNMTRVGMKYKKNKK